MSLLGTAQAVSACCIHAQFLVTDRVKAVMNLSLSLASVVHPFEGCRGGTKVPSAKAAGQQAGTPSLQRGVQHEQVSIGMVGK